MDYSAQYLRLHFREVVNTIRERTEDIYWCGIRIEFIYAEKLRLYTAVQRLQN